MPDNEPRSQHVYRQGGRQPGHRAGTPPQPEEGGDTSNTPNARQARPEGGEARTQARRQSNASRGDVVQKGRRRRAGRAPQSREDKERAAAGRPNPVKAFFTELTPLRRNILLAGVALVLVVVILLVALLPSCGASTEPSTSLLPEGSMVVESDYDPDANKLDETAFVGTILPETEDAGLEYCEETLFLGDSNTVRMISYTDVTGCTLQNAIGVEGMGIQSFTTNKCVKFEGYTQLVTMVDAVRILQPRRVVITFGTNNVGGMNLDSFIEHYKKALDAVVEAYPYTDIIIAALPLVDRYHMNESITMANIDKYNAALAVLAEEEGHKFLNWSEAMRDEATGFAVSTYTISDGVHISREGATALFDYFRTHSYIAEDRRPKPLNEIPRRVASPVANITNDGDTRPRSSTTSQPVSSAVSSSQAGTATVVFSAGAGGSLEVNGANVGGSYSTGELALGATTPTVRAVPDAGYRFVAWQGTSSSFDRSNPSLAYTLDSTVEAGQTVGLSALFEPEVSSTSIPEEPVPPPETSSETPPPETSWEPEPPVESVPEEGGAGNEEDGALAEGVAFRFASSASRSG